MMTEYNIVLESLRILLKSNWGEERGGQTKVVNILARNMRTTSETSPAFRKIYWDKT